ncbi:MAG: hypothetical protein WA954_02515 [Parerythrobacter sp.]
MSLTNRLAAIVEAAERIDPYVARVHRLKPAMRMRYDMWRADCDLLHDEAQRNGGAGAAYEGMLDGTFTTPAPSRVLADALALADPPHLPDTMDTHDLAAAWAAMIAD